MVHGGELAIGKGGLRKTMPHFPCLPVTRPSLIVECLILAWNSVVIEKLFYKAQNSCVDCTVERVRIQLRT